MGWEETEKSFVNLILSIAEGKNKNNSGYEIECYKLGEDKFIEKEGYATQFENIKNNSNWIGKRNFVHEVIKNL